MGWNHNDVNVVVIDQDDQVIHTHIWLKNERKEVFCSFIYAHNRYSHRRSLWRSLSKHNIYIHHRPWSIIGDFNVSLYLEESMACGSNRDVAMRDFHDCMEDIEMLDVQSTGLRAHAMFKPYRVSDQTPSILCIPTLGKVKPKPFKFFNVLTTDELFLDVVKTEWDHYISGFFMLRVVKKLKNLKKPMRKLLYDKGNVHANVNKLRTDLDAIQTVLDADPFNVVLREREATCVIEFNEAVLTEEPVKSRVSRSRIDTVTNSEGVVFDNNTVHLAFVKHYEMFLGQEGETSNFNYANLFNVRLSDQEALNMVREISNQEVKDVIFSISDDKSPGPDGFIVAFFKEAWNIIANDVYLVELMHNYHLERCTPRCSFKVDIQKAYETVDWDILRITILGFGFHQKMVSLIMECVTSTLYSICVNGSLHGYFKCKRGLRQRDLTDQFTYHMYCSKMELVNLCFADDLFLFAYGDVGSASIIKKALDEFKNASSLVPSLPKSKLSVKYLGVPWVSLMLMIRDCYKLMDKVQIHVIHHGLWVWPQELLVKYLFLNNYNTHIREDARDSLVWHNIHGNVKKFLVSQVWDDIRDRDSKDLVLMWDVSDSLGMVCSLCESVPDSHDHLFFKCPFAKGMWDRVKVCAGLRALYAQCL
nr:hypothetical protein [Tanacetum cinerariifolium]